ncbi:MAG: copper resistance protein CopC [Actinomycetales bacterium]|nr:copper resistance protein CopC [Actinomycetales bacterium]
MRQPPAHVRPGARGSVRGAAVLVIGLLGALLAAPAAAHDVLVGTDPPDGAVLDTVPTQVVLAFSAPQTDLGAELAVTGADGTAWASGPAVVAGTTVTQALRPGLPDGAYTVAWRSVAQDGHPVSGTFSFEVAAGQAPEATDAPAEPTQTPAATPAPDEPADATPTATAGADDPADGADAADAGRGVPWGVVAAVVVAVVATAVAAVLAQRRRSERG